MTHLSQMTFVHLKQKIKSIALRLKAIAACQSFTLSCVSEFILH